MARSHASRLLRRLTQLAQDAQAAQNAAMLSSARDIVRVNARHHAQPETAPASLAASKAQTLLQRDIAGAVSVVSENAHSFDSDVYYNLDGHRVDDGRFTSFGKDVKQLIPTARVYTDPVRTFAYGTDASFYRLNPKMVIKVQNEQEVTKLLPLARQHSVPVTFRAAGTSLSGQALTDSVLLKISHNGRHWRNYTVHVRSIPSENDDS